MRPRTMEKSAATMSQSDLAPYLLLVAFLPITTALLCLGARTSPQGTLFGVTVGEGEEAAAWMRRFGQPIRRFYFRANVAYGVIALCLSLLPPALGFPADKAPLVPTTLLTLQTVAWAVIYARSRGRVLRAIQGTDLEPQAAEADRHWKLGGMVYFNPDDPTVNVPKRFGVGITLNMARPISWVIILLPLFFTAFIVGVLHLVT